MYLYFRKKINAMKKIILAVVLLNSLFLLPVRADEGMWLPLFLKALNEADMQSKGLKVQAYRDGNINFLHHLVDQGTPPIVMLEFNNDLMEQHYVVVVGYNAANHTIILHDSIDGPYMQYDEDTFLAMWQSKDLVNLPLFGSENYQGLTIVASK